eukprot:jgi/Psemu1/304710/fgenesh1_kg.166_\
METVSKSIGGYKHDNSTAASDVGGISTSTSTGTGTSEMKKLSPDESNISGTVVPVVRVLCKPVSSQPERGESEGNNEKRVVVATVSATIVGRQPASSVPNDKQKSTGSTSKEDHSSPLPPSPPPPSPTPTTSNSPQSTQQSQTTTGGNSNNTVGNLSLPELWKRYDLTASEGVAKHDREELEIVENQVWKKRITVPYNGVNTIVN